MERGVGRAFGRTEAFPDASVVSVVLAQAAALVRTIYVVRKELAVPVRLAFRLRPDVGTGKNRLAWRESCAIGAIGWPGLTSVIAYVSEVGSAVVLSP